MKIELEEVGMVFPTLENWNIEELTGYAPLTTFYLDFSIADKFGVKAVKDTYDRAFEEWKGSYKYLTELVMVLNWKCNRWYEVRGDLCNLYRDLYYELDGWCLNHLKGEQLKYYLKVTD